ncbi:hypothetical protein C900_02152 [Fulvivirga imtechensis AK7]|uniref:Carbohydrate kinase PfkB domain-containing protein n=1 Tax=Fulvivirga imtechensis AK7 TaxID=1237149 RepID=L8JUJ5_9BACT|nr:hypothetical protein [Fulvivirga imtechensis]ELR71913.1 hypothetical protein C900_02152 [Fulvivirga imtechensis AK7]
MDKSTNLLSELRQQLGTVEKLSSGKQVFVGFDGFVDQIRKAVKQKDKDKTVYFKTLHEFAERIQAASGKSGQVEMVTQKVKLGGNAPILANTLGRLGIDSVCLGTLGYPERHEVFREMSDKCQLISVLDPGRSDAIEFEDGKMIFSELSVFDHYDWLHIKKTVDLDKMREVIGKSDLLAFVNWVNLPHANDIWTGLLDDVIKPSGKRDFLFLFDLSDPTKRTPDQIDEVLDIMSSFFPYGKVTLGLNENETLKLWAAINNLDISQPDVIDRIPPVKQAGADVYKAMNIDCLLVHPVDRTILYHQNEVLELKGRLVTEPKVLTGGGDNLNAGYCLGLLCGFSLSHCMLLGMAASGAYIQNGSGADIDTIINYIDTWMGELATEAEQVLQE